MDTSLLARDTQTAFLEKLKKIICNNLAETDAEDVHRFAEHYFEQYPLEELAGRRLSDIYGSTFSWWNFIRHHDNQSSKVRVFNPTLEEDGWHCSHTVITILQRDMPFLVDTVRMVLNKRNILIHALKSTVFNVGREKGSQFTHLLPALETPADSNGVYYCKEALMYLEINLQTDRKELKSITEALEQVLEQVATITDDFQPMVDHSLQLLDQFDELPKKIRDQLHLEENTAFLQWLTEGNFVFFGYSEFLYRTQKNTVILEEQCEQRLGLIRSTKLYRNALMLNTDDVSGASSAQNKESLIFAKSGIRSQIHRDTYCDVIVIKTYDAQGIATGERRFLGLFSDRTHNVNPSRIPVLRHKLTQVMKRSQFHAESHDGRVLRLLLETFPRDELFQCSADEIFVATAAIARINERRGVRLFMRTDPHGDFVNCIVYVPRDIFNSQVREQIQDVIAKALNASNYDYTTFFSHSILVRCYLVFKVDAANLIEFNPQYIEEQVIDVTRTWQDHLLSVLVESAGEEKGSQLFHQYESAFSNGYQESYDPRTAIKDIDAVDSLDVNDVAMSFYRPIGADERSLRFKIFHLNSGVELSVIIPILENLGFRVIGEHPYAIRRADGHTVWLHDFDLVFGLTVNIDVKAARNYFQDAFIAIWKGISESDAFNHLVLGARLHWREVSLLRVYARYLKQTTFNFDQSYIADTLAQHLDITRNLVALFKAYLDPRMKQDNEERIERLNNKIMSGLNDVENLNEDQILRRYMELINATVRTNFFQKTVDNSPKTHISLKLLPKQISDIPEPKPEYEIFVYSPEVEGVHLRGGKVARGGLRWSDRQEDYRTEILGLAKAQQVKNAVIVPNGAKGGFVIKSNTQGLNRQQLLEKGQHSYRTFIRGLLDVTDNLIGGEVIAPEDVVRRDGDDPYFVVAADKGTASFSDIANSISKEYGFWLGDAFASGGSAGYDHKKMGITAKGAWVSVQRHFRERGVDIQSESVSVIGIGDMGGDVFGNGMLLSEKIKLVAAFNHMHIFIDPDPNCELSYQERRRLFLQPNSSWQDYKQTLISKGGGVFSRNVKSITLTQQMRELLNIDASQLSPNKLIHHLLKAPVDLIWNGGVGTYIKAHDETHADVGDKANDLLRVDAQELRCKVLGEGGNLGITQRARIEFANHGGACNADFIDNAGGVDCSDHEVNIKILLNDVVANGDMTAKQRNVLLENMTEEIATLVLDNNYCQTQAITIAQSDAENRLSEYLHYIGWLESKGHLSRELEALASDDKFLERQSVGGSLTRPELSVLISYAKIVLKEALITSDVPGITYMTCFLESGFPQQITANHNQSLKDHPLQKEIVATQLANDMINNMGITFYYRLQQSGATVNEIANAYVLARDIWNMSSFWQELRKLDHQIESDVQSKLATIMIRQVRQSTRWFLSNRRNNICTTDDVVGYRPKVETLCKVIPSLLRGSSKALWQQNLEHFQSQGVPQDLAVQAAIPKDLLSVLGMVEAANKSGMDVEQIAKVAFALDERLNLQWFSSQLNGVHVQNYWHAMARESCTDELESHVRTLTISIGNNIKASDQENPSIDEHVALWILQHESTVKRWQALITELQADTTTDFAMLYVALQELAQLARHCS